MNHQPHHCPQHGMRNPCPPANPPCCPPASAPIPTGCTCCLKVSDTSSINLSVSGSGTQSDCWTVSGQIIIDPTSSAPVVVTSSGLKIDCCPETVTTLADNGNGTYTYVNEVGTSTTIIDQNTTYTLTDAGNGQIALNGSDGTQNLVDVCALISANCTDALVDNGDGSFTHTALDGTEVTFTVPQSQLNDNGDGTFTHTNGLGEESIIDVCQLVADGGCTDEFSFVTNPDGSITVTHTALDGIVVKGTIPDPGSDSFTFVNNNDGTYSITHTDLDGNVVVGLIECCVYQFSADVTYIDGDSPTGSGTPSDPFLLPLPQFTYVEYVEAVHGDLSAPNIVGDGSTSAPYQIPICCDDTTIEILNITDETVVNADGTTTVTWTILEEDDADGNTPSHPFSITLPAPQNWVYVNYDETIHVDGADPVGDGSPADPFQIPLPCPCCDHPHTKVEACISASIDIADHCAPGNPPEIVCAITSRPLCEGGWGDTNGQTPSQFPPPAERVSCTFQTTNATDCIVIVHVNASGYDWAPWGVNAALTTTLPGGPTLNGVQNMNPIVEDVPFYYFTGVENFNSANYSTFWFPASGGTETLELFFASGTDGQGLPTTAPEILTWNAVEVCGVDISNPFAEVGTPSTSPVGNAVPGGEPLHYTMGLDAPADCHALGIVSGWHLINTEANGTVSGENFFHTGCNIPQVGDPNYAETSLTCATAGLEFACNAHSNIYSYPAGTVSTEVQFPANGTDYAELSEGYMLSFNPDPSNVTEGTEGSSTSYMIPESAICIDYVNDSCMETNLRLETQASEILSMTGPDDNICVNLWVDGSKVSTIHRNNNSDGVSPSQESTNGIYSVCLPNPVAADGGSSQVCAQLELVVHECVDGTTGAVVLDDFCYTLHADHVN